MKKIFVLVMTMALATGCASLRKHSHTTQVRTVDSVIQADAKGMSATTIISIIDTTVIVPADTFEYTLPYEYWAADSNCIMPQDGTANHSIDAVANGLYGVDSMPKTDLPKVGKLKKQYQPKEWVINTPNAKARFVQLGGQWKAQIIVPQKSIPIKQLNYTHTIIDTSKSVAAHVQTETSIKQSTKEVKSGWRIYALGIASVLVLWLIIKFLIKKYL
jgi:uncharacterized protein YceK